MQKTTMKHVLTPPMGRLQKCTFKICEIELRNWGSPVVFDSFVSEQLTEVSMGFCIRVTRLDENSKWFVKNKQSFFVFTDSRRQRGTRL